MFCSNCGKPITEEDQFCVHCGSSAKQQEAADAPARAGRHYGPWPLVGVVIAGLILIAIILVVATGRTNNDDRIVGRWQKVDSGAWSEYFSDGTVRIYSPSDNITIGGRYSFLEDGRLKIETSIFGLSNIAIYGVLIRGDELTFTHEDGHTEVYRRVHRGNEITERHIEEQRGERGTGETEATSVPQVINGMLDSSDQVRDDGSYYEEHTVVTPAGSRLVVTLQSTDFDAYLTVFSPSNQTYSDDDGGGGTHSRVEIPATEGGTYRIWANTLLAGDTGTFTLTMERR